MTVNLPPTPIWVTATHTERRALRLTFPVTWYSAFSLPPPRNSLLATVNVVIDAGVATRFARAW